MGRSETTGASAGTPLTSIRNIGPALQDSFIAAGISSAEELRQLGTDVAYSRLLAAGHRPHFIGYYVIEMGLQGRPWNDCQGAEKLALRKRFDAIVATSFDRGLSDFEKTLDEIGVGTRRAKSPLAAPQNRSA